MRGPTHTGLAIALVFATSTAVASGQRGAPPPPAPASAVGSAISGVVFDSATERPLPGAVVTLTPVSTATVNAGLATMGPVMRQITDELGRFVFTGLLGNRDYTITATKLGYFDGAFGRRAFVGAGGQPRRISLIDRQWFRDARIELIKPGAISGTVTNETGEPLVGVTVRAYAELFVGGVRQLASGVSAATDDRGMYRLASLPPGRYFVAVPSVQQAAPADLLSNPLEPRLAAEQDALAREINLRRSPAFAADPVHRLVLGPGSPPLAPSAAGRPQVYPMTFYPAARTVSDATAIELQPGVDRPAVDVQLRAVPAFRVSGHLEAPPEGVSGMSLRLLSVGMEGLGRGSEHATALVGKEGTFTFLNVPAGAYTLIASRSITEYVTAAGSGFTRTMESPGVAFTSLSSSAVLSAPSGTMTMRLMTGGDQRYHGRQTLNVSNRDVNDVVVPMRAGITISGRIVMESGEGVAVQPRPMVVIAQPASGDLSLGQPRSTPDPDDPPELFWIQGVLPGSYLLQVQGGIFGVVKSVKWNNIDYGDMPIEIEGDRDVKGIIVTLTSQTTALAGTIRDRTGEAASNSALIVFPADRARWTNFGLQPARIRSIPASTTGTYSLSGLPAGDYLAIAVDGDSANRWMDPGFFELASRAATRFSLNWGEKKTMDVALQDIR
jgi:hypothetical protein